MIVLLLLALGAVYIYNIRRLNNRLHQTILIRDKLFSIIGHDLRNPMGGIPHLLAMIEEGDLNQDEQKEIFSMIKKQADVSLEILNSLLLWGQTQLQGIQVHQTNFRPASIVNKNTEVLSHQQQSKSIEIINQIPGTLVIQGDENHFDFIMRNLLSNAVKFSFALGSIEVNADTVSLTDQVIFSVRDFGRGISAQQIGKFTSGNLDVSFGTKGEKGTGFGLMLSKEFVKANKGRLWVEVSKEREQHSTLHFVWQSRFCIGNR